MSIKIQEKIIVANEQNIECVQFSMIKLIDKGWVGTISFNVMDENGKFVKKDSVAIEPKDWNTFWASFNTGTDLYKKKYPNVTNIETDFENTATVAIAETAEVVN